MTRLLRAAIYLVAGFMLIARASRAGELPTPPIEEQLPTCSAQTPCASGATAWCQTFGSACTFYVQPYQYVRCTGLNSWGQWVDVVVSCY